MVQSSTQTTRQNNNTTRQAEIIPVQIQNKYMQLKYSLIGITYLIVFMLFSMHYCQHAWADLAESQDIGVWLWPPWYPPYHPYYSFCAGIVFFLFSLFPLYKAGKMGRDPKETPIKTQNWTRLTAELSVLGLSLCFLYEQLTIARMKGIVFHSDFSTPIVPHGTYFISGLLCLGGALYCCSKMGYHSKDKRT
jgi:hypothetical protein